MVILLLPWNHGYAEETAADTMIANALTYCLPSSAFGQPVADLISASEDATAPTLLPEKYQSQFLKGQEGKVWRVSGQHQVVLSAIESVSLCQVLARKVQPAELMSKLDRWFLNEASPMKAIPLPSQKPDILQRTYCGKLGEGYVLVESSATSSAQTNLQGLITVGRVDGCE